MGFYWVLWASPTQLHYPSSLRFMGLPLTPYFLCFHCFRPVVTHSHFSTLYTAHGLLFLSFWTPLNPFTPLKAHLFISWACDPLFLPLELNEFSIHLPTLFCPCCWVSPFHLGFQNGHQQWVWLDNTQVMGPTNSSNLSTCHWNSVFGFWKQVKLVFCFGHSHPFYWVIEWWKPWFKTNPNKCWAVGSTRFGWWKQKTEWYHSKLSSSKQALKDWKI